MIPAPLYAVTEKGTIYGRTAECQQAFEALKLRLMSELVSWSLTSLFSTNMAISETMAHVRAHSCVTYGHRDLHFRL